MFQTLVHTVGLAPVDWRVLDEAHKKRNLVEYEGAADVDRAMVTAIIRVARVLGLGPVPEPT